LIRWTGTCWELLDRGSRNGTFLDGVPITAGQNQRLSRGSVLAFGHAQERWLLDDASEPAVMVLGSSAEVWSLCEDGCIGLPSGERPDSQLFRDVDASWKLERPGQPTIVVRHGDRFEASGSWWRFSCPEPVGATATSEQIYSPGSATLIFSVSKDEEFVELKVESERGTLNLGSRAHNYLLLTLARTRLQDLADGVAETACGWTDKDQLAQKLSMTPEQIDGEIFRIRQHFGRYGLNDAATIVERRPRIKQLRIGWRHLKISGV